VKKPINVEEYISSFPSEKQEIMQKIRKIIAQTAPHAIETISYGMPAYKSSGRPLVYFAANTKHLGFYPASTSTVDMFKQAGFKTTKGSVHLPYNQPLPEEMIIEAVKFRLLENEVKNRPK